MRTVKKGTVTTLITGGLGNQLFKIMAGIRIAEELNKDLIVDISHYGSEKSGRTKLNRRDFELNYFPNLAQFNFHKEDMNFCKQNFIRIVKRAPIFIRVRLGYFDDNAMNAGRTRKFITTLIGSFENVDFLPGKDRISDLLTFPSSTSMWFDNHYKRIQLESPVVIHVRQGDYLNFPQIYDLLTPSYYHDGIAKLFDKMGERKVWIFSDDSKSAMNWLGDSLETFETEFIATPEIVEPGEVLRLMSLAEGIVTAHSTFSWWAAFIGWVNGTTKSVVIPSKYFSPSSNLRNNLRVNSWIVLDV
jgi:hypothetical protein